MCAALNRPGADCRPLRMPATRIGRVPATLNRETGGTRQRESSRVLAPGRPGPGCRTWDKAFVRVQRDLALQESEQCGGDA